MKNDLIAVMNPCFLADIFVIKSIDYEYLNVDDEVTVEHFNVYVKISGSKIEEFGAHIERRMSADFDSIKNSRLRVEVTPKLRRIFNTLDISILRNECWKDLANRHLLWGHRQ